MPSNAEEDQWAKNLAAYKAANPGASAQDYANSIQDGRESSAEALALAQFEASLGISEASLELAREQFDYQKGRDEDKTKNIEESMSSIKGIFEGRNPIYDTLKAESYQLNQERLTDLQDDAGRDMNFALARAGNVGGSVEIDKNKEMAERMGLGMANAEMYAQSQADELRAQDEQLKGSLMGLASSGAVKGDIASNLATQSTRGRNGTANFTPNINNTFANMSSGIGGAQQTPQQRGGF